MRAVIQLTNRDRRTCTAKTDNDLAVVFTVVDAAELHPGDEIDVQLPEVLQTGLIHRIPPGPPISVRLQRFDIHDLRRVGAGHGMPSQVTEARMNAK